MAADQHQLVVAAGPAAQIGLLQRAALGAHQQHPPPRQHRNRLHRGIHRLWFEHHAGTAAVGLVVDFAVFVGGEIAGVVGVERGDAGSKGPADHPQIQQRRKGLRCQAHHIKAH